ncbi:hypothetical protein EKH57_15945 [Halorubrum sp. BOL3-1]|uniref:hypothetical protein n=1 Tax=Halorubrum sp. BOL3-1 TaxID=2497325 RepID=UPI0010050C7C|nr:hypothetical protein [Halorubrum sp. BOL3-1]QAU14069.1 hypothetical protein EKH57_15945 [Halorubrum sp. BOL3-1]
MEYQPGVRNIGRSERRRRFALGVTSLLMATGVVAGVLSVGLAPEMVLFTLPFIYAATVAFIQYRERFCAVFALLGVFNVGDGTSKVTDPRAVEVDRRRALLLHIWASVVAVVVSVLMYGFVVITLV